MRLEFDLNNNVEKPELVLGKRNYDKFGSILNFDNLTYDYNLMSANSISFTVYKELNNEKERLWDEIKERRLIWLKEFNEWFQIDVATNDDGEITKEITGTPLCEAELGQILIKSTEINTENDIARDDYTNPTVFYKPSSPNESLLHRLLKVAPNYTIKYVDESLWNIQRTFSIDGTSVYDTLTGEIAEEIGCLFLFDSTDRSISVYDLKTNCNHCGYRGDFNDICPECGSTDLDYGYGRDTTIFVDSETLAENISLSGKQDEVKNYIKVSGGDDVINAAIAACNPTGTQYIYTFSERDREDMSDDLLTKLDEYAVEYDTLTPTYQSIMKDVYDAIDEQLYLESTMMPDIETASTNAQKELAKLTSTNLSPIAVQDVSIASVYTANNAVLGMAKCIVNSTVFKIEIIESSFTNQTWKGKFRVTNYSDEEDTAENTGYITITINDDYAYYVEQKIKKTIDRDDVYLVDMFDYKTDLSVFKAELKKYCLSRLNSFESAYQTIIDVLIEANCSNDSTYGDIYNDLYMPYYNKLIAIQSEIKVRASEIEIVDARLTELEKSRSEITEHLNIQNYLGDELWKELCSFRREDSYENSNYISDGLDNSEILAKAQELFNKAKSEAITASTLQMSLSTTMFNLLAIPEFQKLTGMFEGGNWIRVGLDDKIYRLRLIHYKIDFSEIQNIEVEFSDVTQTANGLNDTKSLMDKVASMATNFSYVAHQAEQGSKSFAELDTIRNDGLNAALYSISNSVNQEFIIDEHGITGRKWDDILGDYSPEQVKMNNNILVYTNDYWQTAKSALGKIEYYNPILKTTVSQYGLIADAVISGILMGNDIIGGDIYSENYSSTAGTHIDLNTGDFTFAGGKLIYDSKKDILNLTGKITFEDIDYSSPEAKKALQDSLGITDVQNDIDEFNNASILTPLEKKNMLDDWTSIQSEYQKNIELAKVFEVSDNSIVIAYTNAYNTLATQISKCDLDNLTTSTTIDTRIYNDINNYHAANVDFANLINKEAKKLSEQALADAKAYSNEEISKLSTSVNKEISDLNTELTDTQSYLDGAFKDGIVDDIELSKINQLIKQIEIEKLDVDNQYTSIYNNSFLNTDTKANLKNTYDSYNNSHTSLINYINNAITILNSTVTQVEKQTAIENVNSSFDVYKEKITKIYEILNSALDEISTLKVSDLRDSVNKDISDVNTLISDTKTYIDGAFYDQVIDESESASISQLLYRLNTEKSDIDSRYTSIYNNTSISTTLKNNLKSAKDTYDTSHTNLISLINTAVSVVKDTTKTETQKQTAINNMNNAFSDYDSKISVLSSAFESAIDSISTNKLDAFVNGDYKTFVSDIQTQVDGKSETYYQSTQPYENHLNVSENSNYNKLVGDLWYDSDESVKKTYVYVKTANGNNYDYKWMEMEVPVEIFDMADGKAQIFTSKPSNYNKNDLWLVGSDYVPTISGVKIGYVLVSLNNNTGYTESDWKLSIEYSDDTVANNALNVATQAVSDNILTPSEKRDLLNEINSIKASYSKYTSICSVMNIAYTGYTTAYNNLINNMTGSSSVYKLDSSVNTNLTSTQVTNFMNYFSNYYTAEANIIQSIQNATNTNVSNAQTAAEQAQADATEALGLLADIASDNKITPVEKLQLEEKYNTIKASHEVLMEKYDNSDYNTYAAFLSYKTAYENLCGMCDEILKDKDSTYLLVQMYMTWDDETTYITYGACDGTHLNEYDTEEFIEKTIVLNSDATLNFDGDLTYGSGVTGYLVWELYDSSKKLIETFLPYDSDGNVIIPSYHVKAGTYIVKLYGRLKDTAFHEEITTDDGYYLMLILDAILDSYTRDTYNSIISNYYEQYQLLTNEIISNIETNVGNVKNLAEEAKSLGSELKKCLGFSTEISSDYVISPYIGGGYLNITNSSYGSVIIDPSNLKSSGYIFGVYDSSNDLVMGVNTSGSATFKGSITSTSGNIGGFTIGSSAIYNGTNSMTSTTAGIYLGTDGIRQYQSSSAYVNISSGVLTAKGANISGTITAADGTIGGWSLNSSAIYRNYSTFGTSGGMYFGTSGLSIGSNFKVTSGGTVTANGTFATDSSGTYAKLSDNSLTFYKDSTELSSFSTTYWNGTDIYGTAVNSDAPSKFITFGNKTSSSDSTYITKFLLNYGLNPDGIPEGVIAFDSFHSTGNVITRSSFGLNSPGIVTLTSGRVTAWDGTAWGINTSSSGTGLYVFGNIGCSGTKARIVHTEHYGEIELNAYETATPYFGDLGSGECDENGLCYIYLDEIFKETIINECNYYVFLQQYGEFNVYPIEKNKDYFVVKGEPYQKFDFEIKCRQIGTDNMRLNRVGDKIESEE